MPFATKTRCATIQIIVPRDGKTMKSLSIREVRKELAQIDDLVSREGEIVVTRHGRPIARLLPIRATQPMPSHAALRASMPRLKKGSEDYVHADREER